jgi:hypothetical protein
MHGTPSDFAPETPAAQEKLGKGATEKVPFRVRAGGNPEWHLFPDDFTHPASTGRPVAALFG